MTPKEKAIELVESMAFSCRECDYEFKAKQCALIAVDEVTNELASRGILSGFWYEVHLELKKL